MNPIFIVILAVFGLPLALVLLAAAVLLAVRAADWMAHRLFERR